MEKGKLYQVSRGNTGPSAGVILKGDSVNIDIYGSQSKPAALANMVDITGEGTITAAGAVAFALLPEYIAFDGNADAIEVVGVVLNEVRDIS
nr:hypothetical protein [uncultured Draconibacterium sp.]